MGTFAELFVEGKGVPDNKTEEFAEKIKKVFQCGGMMDIVPVNLCGKKTVTIRKAQMDSEGMDFFYNYFEDARWENAGFSCKSNSVWSNKIGWLHFHTAVVAAYVLQEQYTEGIASAMVDGEPVISWRYVGWLNYLFDETNHVKNFDTWKLFEAFYYCDDEYSSWDDWNKWYGFGDTRYAFVSSCEIHSVIYGVDKTIEWAETRERTKVEDLALSGMRCAKRLLESYVQNVSCDKEEQYTQIMKEIRQYYESDSFQNDEEGNYKALLTALEISDARAFVIKAIAETYDKDFKELWTTIKDIVRRKNERIYSNDDYYVVPISTQDVFKQLPDDMIPYWEDDGKIIFSEELWEWFRDLKRKYELIMSDDIETRNLLQYMLDLMIEADENYYNVFAFADFFEESLENLSDKRYQTLWRLYDMLIHDPELMAAGDVIFVPDGPEHEHEGIHYWGEQPKRRLIRNWDFMSLDEKNNKGRITLKRYMALVANKPLRKRVFGF